jgi:hypothetical protein
MSTHDETLYFKSESSFTFTLQSSSRNESLGEMAQKEAWHDRLHASHSDAIFTVIILRSSLFFLISFFFAHYHSHRGGILLYSRNLISYFLDLS